jgi:hypothetical protein
MEAAWRGDLDQIKAFTLQSWDDDMTEPPLKIAMTDMHSNSPFSLAFLRGHHEVAKAILGIAKAQYSPDEKDASRYKMQTEDGDDEDYDSEEDYESDEDDSDSDSGGHNEVRIVTETMNKKFTIENIGQVSMQVKSKTRPIELLIWDAPSFKLVNGKATDYNLSKEKLFYYVIDRNDSTGLSVLLEMAAHCSGQKLKGDTDEESAGYFTFPERDFRFAIQKGRVQLLAEIIRQTGAGIPLDHLVKKSGIELKVKPRSYQGLTVYGKKRYAPNSTTKSIVPSRIFG